MLVIMCSLVYFNLPSDEVGSLCGHLDFRSAYSLQSKLESGLCFPAFICSALMAGYGNFQRREHLLRFPQSSLAPFHGCDVILPLLLHPRIQQGKEGGNLLLLCFSLFSNAATELFEHLLSQCHQRNLLLIQHSDSTYDTNMLVRHKG